MNRRWLWLLAFPLLLLSAVALAQTATSTPTFDPSTIGLGDVGALTDVAGRAFASRKWMLLAGLLLTAVIAGIRAFKITDKIKGAWVPWITLAISMLTSVAVGIQQHKSWTTILVGGFSVGITAIGGWEVFGKLIRDLIGKIKAKFGK